MARSFRDRFFTPKVARAIMAPWRFVVAAAVGLGLGMAGVAWPLAVLAGAAGWSLTVLAAVPRASRPVAIDPFVLSEPWRRHVSAAQSAARRFDAIVKSTRQGPLHDRLASIGEQLQHGLQECWQIARRGDQLDATLSQMNSSHAERRLEAMKAEHSGSPDAETEATMTSLAAQVAAATRIRATSRDTADRLRLAQTQLDQLVTQAAEVAAATVGDHDLETRVADLVTELEALRLAVDDTPQTSPGA